MESKSRFRGEWEYGAAYEPLDIVDMNGVIYLCLEYHTYSEHEPPDNKRYWREYFDIDE